MMYNDKMRIFLLGLVMFNLIIVNTACAKYVEHIPGLEKGKFFGATIDNIHLLASCFGKDHKELQEIAKQISDKKEDEQTIFKLLDEAKKDKQTILKLQLHKAECEKYYLSTTLSEADEDKETILKLRKLHCEIETQYNYLKDMFKNELKNTFHDKLKKSRTMADKAGSDFKQMEEIGRKINAIREIIYENPSDEENGYNFLWFRLHQKYMLMNPLLLKNEPSVVMQTVFEQINEMPFVFAQIALKEEIRYLEQKQKGHLSNQIQLQVAQIKLLRQAEFMYHNETNSGHEFVYESTIENVDKFKIEDILKVVKFMDSRDKNEYDEFYKILNETTIIKITTNKEYSLVIFSTNEIYAPGKQFVNHN